jgi:hypothetical protein
MLANVVLNKDQPLVVLKNGDQQDFQEAGKEGHFQLAQQKGIVLITM